MKKCLLFAISILISISTAYAGVSRIVSNGEVEGVPSFRVECTSGSDYIIYKKNGSTWYRGDIGHMGNKYDSWSTEEVAEFVCD
ncbi:hypothetical protein [Aeromonas veronii]|uniref:hypothetical protein n=1 Tax=Aeromonas veronii TaxID=654 RepID=UPI003BA2CD3C